MSYEKTYEVVSGKLEITEKISKEEVEKKIVNLEKKKINLLEEDAKVHQQLDTVDNEITIFTDSLKDFA